MANPGRESVLVDFTKHRGWAEDLIIVSQLGLTMAGSIVLCFFVGLYLDRWLGTGGVFLVIFTLLGITGGGATAYRRITEITTKRADSRKASDDSIG